MYLSNKKQTHGLGGLSTAKNVAELKGKTSQTKTTTRGKLYTVFDKTIVWIYLPKTNNKKVTVDSKKLEKSTSIQRTCCSLFNLTDLPIPGDFEGFRLYSCFPFQSSSFIIIIFFFYKQVKEPPKRSKRLSVECSVQ